MSRIKPVRHVIRDVPQHWVGDGFPVRSLFSYADGNEFDPFLLLDYAGPHEFDPTDSTRGVGAHPHRGFETVTIVYQGELEHRDSSGSRGTIGPGDVQWMTAASGIVHEEFHSQRFAKAGGTLEMVQLWVNLPAGDKSTPPRYQGLLDEQIPQVSFPDSAGIARVIAGELLDTVGPAQTFTRINVWDLQLRAGASVSLAIPGGHASLLIVQTGQITIGGAELKSVGLALFEQEGDTIEVTASEDARLLVLSGEPIGEPVVGRGPFVMNTEAEIREAIADYQAGRMGQLK